MVQLFLCLLYSCLLYYVYCIMFNLPFLRSKKDNGVKNLLEALNGERPDTVVNGEKT